MTNQPLADEMTVAVSAHAQEVPSSVVRAVFCSACLSVALFIMAPRAAAWLVPALGIAALLFVQVKSLRPSTLPLPIGLGFCLAVYALCSGIWSPSPATTAVSAALLALNVAGVWGMMQYVGTLPTTIMRALACGIAAGVLAGAAYTLVELATDNAVQKALFNAIPFTRPRSPEHVGMLNGQVSFRSPVELKRGVGMLNLLLWPGILCLTSSRARLGLAAVGIVTTLVAPHDTSILAILAALATIAIFSISARAAKTVVVAGWIACTLFIVPIAGLAYKADLHLANWLPVNARARIIIWAATAEATRKAPWLGIGADATKILIKTSDAGEKRADHVLDWNTGRHAHDVYLQVWYELGLVGALLLSGFGLSILRAIDRLEGDAQRLALCTFASAAVIASFSWGVWQSWYLAAFAASATAAAVAIRPSSMGSTNIA